MVILVRGRGAGNIEEKKKTDRRKTLKMKKKKNKENEESQIATINIFGFTFYIKKLFYSKT